MGFGIVSNLVAHSRSQSELSAVSCLGLDLARETENDVAFSTPVICQITRSILHHANADLAEVLGATVGGAALAWVFRRLDEAPVRRSEGDAQKFHL
jgi:hypothetical protein